MNARQFRSAFEPAFAPAAAEASLARTRGATLKWIRRTADGFSLTFGFRLNLKNAASYPGEFMPDIHWSAPVSTPSDSGEVSFFQYTTPQEQEAIRALQRAIVDRFIREQRLDEERGDPRSLTGLLAARCDGEIRPHQPSWLPYWTPEDAAAWGDLFGRLVRPWVPRFLDAPETLDAWCRRKLWHNPAS